MLGIKQEFPSKPAISFANKRIKTYTRVIYSTAPTTVTFSAGGGESRLVET